ncbi:putative AAA+ family ATPase [Chlorella virus XW01]|nr:putative AAA+ family ATPase [Chlorella virus XW01]
MNSELLIQSLIFNNLMNNDNKYLSILVMFLMMTIFNNIELIKEYFSYYFDKKNSEIHFCQEENNIPSKRFKAIMHYIVHNPNPTIRILADHVVRAYNNDDLLEEKSQIYRINQFDKFKIDKNIYGSFKVEKKEVKKYTDIHKINIYKMVVFSDKLSVDELKEWIEDKTKEYEHYQEEKLLNHQYIFTIKTEDKSLLVDANKWLSNVTFENRFFEHKDDILNKINFFLNNKKWYERKGIPYTLGILLYGDPGCGKTSFIKALLNLTKRHAIDIKLNENFDFSILSEIMNKDRLNEEYAIPSHKKIIILEDIDCMDKIVKSRYNDTSNDNFQELSDDDNALHKNSNKLNLEQSLGTLLKKINQKTNNSLSELLNIFDGIEESNGRIVIMTSNKPHDLDPALIRPGRIDIKIHFKNASIDEFKKIINHYYEKDYKYPDELKDNVDYKYSPAEIINICRRYINIEECIEYFNLKLI